MRALALLGAVALVGCTATTANMLDERTLYISGAGNAFTGMGQVQQAAIVRAATEAQRRGFTHFMILDARDSSTVGTYTTPTQTTGSATGSCMGAFCSATGSATTTGGQTFQFNRPGADMLIRFLTAEEAAGVSGAWSVASVLAANPTAK